MRVMFSACAFFNAMQKFLRRSNPPLLLLPFRSWQNSARGKLGPRVVPGYRTGLVSANWQ